MLEWIVQNLEVLNPSETFARHFYGYLRVLRQVSRSFREQSMRLDMTWLQPGTVSLSFPRNDYYSQAVRALFGRSGPAMSDAMAVRNERKGMKSFLEQVQFAVQWATNPRYLWSAWLPPLFIKSTGLPYSAEASGPESRNHARKPRRRSRQMSAVRLPNLNRDPHIGLRGSGPTAGGWAVNLNGEGRSAEHENFLASSAREFGVIDRLSTKRKHGQ